MLLYWLIAREHYYTEAQFIAYDLSFMVYGSNLWSILYGTCTCYDKDWPGNDYM